MSTLLHTRPEVHSHSEAHAHVAVAVVPVAVAVAVADESFEPSEKDRLYWLAFSAALDGEDPDFHQPFRGYDSADLSLAFLRGAREGKRERERRAAFAIGKTLGVISDICCPPSGYAPHEALAYREGLAVGQREFEEAREFEAWVASVEAERMEEAFGYELQDSDIYPLGCVS